jgi:hypothetical protein
MPSEFDCDNPPHDCEKPLSNDCDNKKNTKISEIQFHIEELSEWCESMEKRIRGLENEKT